MGPKDAFQTLLVASSLQYKAGIPTLALDLAHEGGQRVFLYGELDDLTLAALQVQGLRLHDAQQVPCRGGNALPFLQEWQLCATAEEIEIGKYRWRRHRRHQEGRLISRIARSPQRRPTTAR